MASVGDMQRVKAIVILGCGHSGSTLLERLLAADPNCVGLGEVDLTLRKLALQGYQALKPCTCGREASECPVWSACATMNASRRQDGLISLIAHARNVTGREVIIDSSKRRHQAEEYKFLSGRGLVQFISVYLVRDVRSWALSRKVSSQDRGASVLPYIYRCWLWMFLNFWNRFQLVEKGISVQTIFYEDLVHQPQPVIGQILARFRIKIKKEISQIDSLQHSLEGNRMRKLPEYNSKIVIDDSWRDDWRTKWLGLTIFGPLLYNRFLRRKARRAL